MRDRNIFIHFSTITISTLLIASSLFAGGPLVVNGAGEPLLWSSPVAYTADQGTLGSLNNAEAVALVNSLFQVWQDVPTSSISFTQAGLLSVDVDSSNFESFIGVSDGISPIIFDADGSLTDAILGEGARSSVLGFAGPEDGTFVPPVITEGFAVLNGLFIDGVSSSGNPELTIDQFKGVFVHEFGHFCNLDHTQINLDVATDGFEDSDDFDTIPTMFPVIFTLTQAEGQQTLNPDDIAWISALYPETVNNAPTSVSFTSTTGIITGTIFESDGTTHFQGANVIARNTSNGRIDAVSNVSGARYFPGNEGGPPPANLEGLYELPGLTDGASYTVEIEQIDGRFTGGSGVGPVDPPATLAGPAEFYNGEQESGDSDVDTPTDSVPVTVAAGSPVTDIDIIFNKKKVCGAARAATAVRQSSLGFLAYCLALAMPMVMFLVLKFRVRDENTTH
ncbi:MAG: hypothetical protein ACE5NG_03520 [bacterium]